MLSTKTLSVAIATLATLSLNAYAGARQHTPLHPTYSAERVTTEFDVPPPQRDLDSSARKDSAQKGNALKLSAINGRSVNGMRFSHGLQGSHNRPVLSVGSVTLSDGSSITMADGPVVK